MERVRPEQSGTFKFILILLLQTSPVPRRIQFQLDTDCMLDVRSSKIPSSLHVGRHLGASDNTSSSRRGSSSGGIMQRYASVASNSSEVNVIGTRVERGSDSVQTLILCYQLLLHSAAHLSSCSSLCVCFDGFSDLRPLNQSDHTQKRVVDSSIDYITMDTVVSDLFPC